MKRRHRFHKSEPSKGLTGAPSDWSGRDIFPKGSGSWVLGTGRIRKNVGRVSIQQDPRAWNRGEALAKLGPKDHGTGFHLYSRNSVKSGVIEGVEAKGCMIGFVFGLEAEFRRLSVRDGLEEERWRD